jgi:C1A family cysteine protease
MYEDRVSLRGPVVSPTSDGGDKKNNNSLGDTKDTSKVYQDTKNYNNTEHIHVGIVPPNFQGQYRLMGLRFAISKYPLKAITDTTVPKTFDLWYKSGLLTEVRDQKSCGSCWAFAITSTLSDRIALRTRGKVNVLLAILYYLVCDTDDGLCDGTNSLPRALDNIEMDSKMGGCYTQLFKYDTNNIPSNLEQANQLCKDLEKEAKEKGLHKYGFAPNSTMNLCDDNEGTLEQNILRMKQEIYENGPIVAGMLVSSGFMAYKEGVFESNPNDRIEGGHAIEIVGWGADDKGEYWIARNSWSKAWGLQGYWFHRMRDKVAQLESQAHAGLPDFSLVQFKGIVSPKLSDEPKITPDFKPPNGPVNPTPDKPDGPVCPTPNCPIPKCDIDTICPKPEKHQDWMLWTALGIFIFLILLILFLIYRNYSFTCDQLIL